MKPIMGVDPGVRGGVAVLAADGRPVFIRGFNPDMSEADATVLLYQAVTALKEERGGRECFMERVGYIPGDGGQGAFTFGKVYGLVRGFLHAHGVVLRDVYPQMWQTKMECLTGGNKNVSKRRAAELFPNVRMTHLIADALLIAEYGRRVRL